MRTIIYARFSSHLQNSRSVADQIALCRDRCRREGWPVLEVYADHAISGAAGIDEAARPGLNAALEHIAGGGVDQLLAESTDRLARHQGDAFAIRERVTYAGARIFTLGDGEVDDITGTIKGLFDARFRKELGAKIRRGQRGSITAGRSAGGLAYGYRRANRLDERGELVRGLREIDDDQAAIVRRIFEEYAAGLSPRAIAGRLNAQGVPSPRGGLWRVSTISGHRRRGHGILQNRIYVGELIFFRTAKASDPLTRRVRIKVNDAAELVAGAAAHLRIVSDALWSQVEAIRHSQPLRPERARRPRHLLSGLGVCSECGGSWILIGSSRWGCSRNRNAGACANNRSIVSSEYERRVLATLAERMLNPDIVAAYVAEYHREHALRSRDLTRRRGRLERRLGAQQLAIERLVAAIAGGADLAEVREALDKARGERERIAGELRDIAAVPVIALHPTIARDYRQQMAELSLALAADDETRLEAMPILRSLIDRILVTPAAAGRGVAVEVQGRLASILALASGVPEAQQRRRNVC